MSAFQVSGDEQVDLWQRPMATDEHSYPQTLAYAGDEPFFQAGITRVCKGEEAYNLNILATCRLPHALTKLRKHAIRVYVLFGHNYEHFSVLFEASSAVWGCCKRVCQS